MASLRDQILDAVITALNTGTPVGVPAATREEKHYEQSQLPAITIRPISETISSVHNRQGLVKDRQLKFIAEIRAVGTIPDKALDKHLVWVTKKLDGFTSSLVNTITEEGEIDWGVGMQDYAEGICTVPYTAYYQTKKGDQESKQ